MIDVLRADDRFPGGDPAAGVVTRHAFSFGGHHDPDRLRHGPLLACNEEWLAPGAGFAAHPHRGTEIVTWVVEGALEHRDDAGHHAVVPAGGGQWLSAGAGVRHTEANASGDLPCRFVQMWLEPSEHGGPPAYGTFGASPVRPPRLPGASLTAGAGTPAVPDSPYGYLHVLSGAVRLGGHRLGPGDAARLTGAHGLAAGPADPGTRYLLWALPEPWRP